MYGWKPYVPVARRRAEAARHVAQSRRSGVGLSPVTIAGRTIASSFWGKSWCEAMESYGDYANRLPRGRTYVRNGSVVDLRIESGLVSASVWGSELYRTSVGVKPLSPAGWRVVVDKHAAQVSSLVDLLQGKLPTSLLHALSDRSSGLFPGPDELTFDCSCPDWASMCKHVAAVLYGVGARLDVDPGLFFLLRGVDVSDLAVRSATVGFASAPGADDLADVDLGSIFGIDLAVEAPVPASAKLAAKSKAVSKPKAVATSKAVSKPKAVAKSKPAAKPLAAPPAPSPITASELRLFGIDPRTVALWLRSGVLARTDERGVYHATAETGAHLRAYVEAARRGRRT